MADQVARMRDRFPDLRHTEYCRWWSTWVGPVRPLHRRYTIQLRYVSRYWLGKLEIINGYVPQVALLDPPLKLEHPRNIGGTIIRSDLSSASTIRRQRSGRRMNFLPTRSCPGPVTGWRVMRDGSPPENGQVEAGIRLDGRGINAG
jgi:hypothetical protein